MVRGVLFTVLLSAGQSLAQWPELNKPLPKQYAGEKDAALIISVSDYAFLPDVPGANENAAAWFQHFTVTRGIPATQVQWLQDNEATVFGIRKALKQLALDVKQAQAAVRLACESLDRAASKGVIHANNAARRKSRLMLAFNRASAAKA